MAVVGDPRTQVPRSESEMTGPKRGDASKRRTVWVEDVALDRKLVEEVIVEDWQNDEQKKMHAAGVLFGRTSGVPIPIPKLSLILTLICLLGARSRRI